MYLRKTYYISFDLTNKTSKHLNNKLILRSM